MYTHPQAFLSRLLKPSGQKAGAFKEFGSVGPACKNSNTGVPGQQSTKLLWTITEKLPLTGWFWLQVCTISSVLPLGASVLSPPNGTGSFPRVNK
jgi:hypothetical protein